MSEFARGGYMPGQAVQVILPSWECVVDRDMHCSRGEGHDPWKAPQIVPRFWTCEALGNRRPDKAAVESAVAILLDRIAGVGERFTWSNRRGEEQA